MERKAGGAAWRNTRASQAGCLEIDIIRRKIRIVPWCVHGLVSQRSGWFRIGRLLQRIFPKVRFDLHELVFNRFEALPARLDKRFPFFEFRKSLIEIKVLLLELGVYLFKPSHGCCEIKLCLVICHQLVHLLHFRF